MGEANASAGEVGTDPLVGKTVGGRYRVQRKLGEGGMGGVYAAEHLLIRGTHALKFLKLDRLETDEASGRAAVQRFYAEAVAANKVADEHIVRYTDAGDHEGTPFLVMECLEGCDLEAEIERLGQLPLARAADIVHQVCQALELVHAAGIVHRDLKSSNVFLVVKDGRDHAKILDFGICKLTQDTRSDPGRRRRAPSTRSGQVMGTVLFMPPEQMRDSSRVDHRADVYAAGVILFHALSGAYPFSGGSIPEIMCAVLNQPPPSIADHCPDLGPRAARLNAIIQKALAKDPDERYQSCAELGRALRPFVAPPRQAIESGMRPRQAFESSAPETLSSWQTKPSLPMKRIWSPATLTVGAIIALALAVAFATRSSLDGDQEHTKSSHPVENKPPPKAYRTPR